MRAVWTTRAAVITLGAIVLASAAWFWQASRRSGPELDLKGANVLLVTIDTLRVDRVGAYGSRAGLTPVTRCPRPQRGAFHQRMVSRADHASRARQHFDRALCRPIMASATTAPSAWELGPRRSLNACGRQGIGPARSSARSSWTPGLASTAASTNTTIAIAPGALPASFHFVERSADDVLRAATQWITQPETGGGRPWFAWVHLFDPHAPYRAPPRSHDGP